MEPGEDCEGLGSAQDSQNAVQTDEYNNLLTVMDLTQFTEKDINNYCVVQQMELGASSLGDITPCY